MKLKDKVCVYYMSNKGVICMGAQFFRYCIIILHITWTAYESINTAFWNSQVHKEKRNFNNQWYCDDQCPRLCSDSQSKIRKEKEEDTNIC